MQHPDTIDFETKMLMARLEQLRSLRQRPASSALPRNSQNHSSSLRTRALFDASPIIPAANRGTEQDAGTSPQIRLNRTALVYSSPVVKLAPTLKRRPLSMYVARPHSEHRGPHLPFQRQSAAPSHSQSERCPGPYSQFRVNTLLHVPATHPRSASFEARMKLATGIYSSDHDGALGDFYEDDGVEIHELDHVLARKNSATQVRFPAAPSADRIVSAEARGALATLRRSQSASVAIARPPVTIAISPISIGTGLDALQQRLEAKEHAKGNRFTSNRWRNSGAEDEPVDRVLAFGPPAAPPSHFLKAPDTVVASGVDLQLSSSMSDILLPSLPPMSVNLLEPQAIVVLAVRTSHSLAQAPLALLPPAFPIQYATVSTAQMMPPTRRRSQPENTPYGTALSPVDVKNTKLGEEMGKLLMVGISPIKLPPTLATPTARKIDDVIMNSIMTATADVDAKAAALRALEEQITQRVAAEVVVLRNQLSSEDSTMRRLSEEELTMKTFEGATSRNKATVQEVDNDIDSSDHLMTKDSTKTVEMYTFAENDSKGPPPLVANKISSMLPLVTTGALELKVMTEDERYQMEALDSILRQVELARLKLLQDAEVTKTSS